MNPHDHPAKTTRAWPFFLLALLLGCGSSPESQNAGAAVPLTTVATDTVARGSFVGKVGVFGRMVARSGHIARPTVPATGRVSAILIELGDAVHRSDTLVELEMQGIEANLVSAEATLAAAQAAWRRSAKLQSEGVTPAREVEQRAAALEAARAAAINARRIASLSVIKSPIDGVVSSLTAAIGTTVDPGATIVEIVDPNALDVELVVSPTIANMIIPGMTAEVSSTSTIGEALGTARINSVGATVDSVGGGVVVRARIALPNRTLRMGESVSASISTKPVEDALLVPIAALVPTGNSFSVFVVDSMRIAHRQEVTIGPKSTRLAVVTAGLAVGDRIVTTGAYGVVDGSLVGIDSGTKK